MEGYIRCALLPHVALLSALPRGGLPRPDHPPLADCDVEARPGGRLRISAVMAMISHEDHARKRESLIKALRAPDTTGPLALEKSTSNLFRQRVQAPRHKLDVRHFNQVIHIDENERYAEVEGMTTYEDL